MQMFHQELVVQIWKSYMCVCFARKSFKADRSALRNGEREHFQWISRVCFQPNHFVFPLPTASVQLYRTGCGRLPLVIEKTRSVHSHVRKTNVTPPQSLSLTFSIKCKGRQAQSTEEKTPNTSGNCTRTNAQLLSGSSVMFRIFIVWKTCISPHQASFFHPEASLFYSFK